MISNRGGIQLAETVTVEPAPKKQTKTLDDVKADMSELYEQVKAGSVELKFAAELANITGKYLKATQLELAREIFLAGQPSAPKALTNAAK